MAAWLVSVYAPQAFAQPNGVVHVDIPAEPLDAAIRAFIRATGLQVAYPAALSQGKQSAAVSGNYRPEDALARLLDRTGLTYRFTGTTTVTLEAPAAATGGAMALPPVQVQGQSQDVLQSPYGPGVGYVATQSVTGMKTDAPIIEIPQLVSVVTRQQMDDQAVQNISQALRYTAGIVPEVRGAQDISDSVDNMYLRGFYPDNYLDGLKLLRGEWGVAQVDPYLLDRIEVLHGPASVLYGQGTPGGIVTMSSKLPTETPYHEVELQAGSYGHVNGGFDLSGSLNQDGTLLYRLTGDALHTGSQVDYSEKNRVAIAPALTWKPDADTTLTLLAQYQNDFGPIYNNFLPAQGTVLFNPYGKIPTNLYAGDPAYDYYRRRQAQIGYMFEHRFDDTWTVRQNLRYQRVDSNYKSLLSDGLESDLIHLDRYTYHDIESLNTVSLDNQVEAKFATGPLHHTLLVGLDYEWNDWRQTGGEDDDNTPTLNIFNPVYFQSIPPANEYLYNSYETQYQVGLYAQDQVKLGRLSFIFGGREDWAGSTTKDNVAATSTPQFDTAFTYRVGAVYVFDNGLAPYASYVTSFDPTVGAGYAGQAFRPTTGQQYEVGVKYQPPGWNSFLTAAAYNLTEQNVLTTDPAHPQFQTQTGEVRARGIELEAHASLNDNLSVIATYSYTDALNTKTNSTATGVDGVRQSEKNKRPNGVPAQLASFWGDYTFHNGAMNGLGFGGGVRYVGSSPGDAVNSFSVPGFVLFDAALHYDLGKAKPVLQGLKLQVNASNLFDKQYVSYCANVAYCTYGLRRAVYGTLRYQW